jgi:hypothetical protein
MEIGVEITDLRVAMSRYDRMYGDDDASFRMVDHRDYAVERGEHPEEELNEESSDEDEDEEEEEEEEDEVLHHIHGEEMEEDEV